MHAFQMDFTKKAKSNSNLALPLEISKKAVWRLSSNTTEIVNAYLTSNLPPSTDKWSRKNEIVLKEFT